MTPRETSEPGPPPRVSVVIASFNERHAIERCLASLERQETSTLFEVILVDSSSDGTAAAAERFSFVRLRQFAERRHCGDARNAGLSLARAGIVAFLDADCFVEHDWIEPHASLSADRGRGSWEF